MAKTKKEKSIEQMLDEALVKENKWPYRIPDNWVWSYLISGFAECLDTYRKPVNATERAKRKGNIPYYGATGQVGWIDDYLTNEELVLVGEDGAPFLDPFKKKSYIIFGKAWVNNHAHILKSLYGSTGNHLLMHYLNSFDYNGYVSGTTRLKLTQKSLREIPLPLPPLEEQNRIVRRLSSMLAKLKEARELIQEAKDSFENRRASILNMAITGKLTQKWREENPEVKSAEKHLEESFLSIKDIYEKRCAECKLKGERKTKKPEILNYYNKAKIKSISKDGLKGWCETNFVNFCILQRGFDLPKKHRSKGNYSVVSSSGVIDRHLEYKVKGPGITVGRSGSVGKTFYIEEDYWPLNTTLFAKETNGNDPKFIFYNFLLFNFEKYSSSTAVPTLNRNNFSEAVIRIPPLEEQKEIVRLLDKILDIECESKELIKLKQHIDLLEKSILSKAFRGELDTNDPNDEPAIKLLEKALQSKKLIPVKPKTRRKGIRGRQIISTSLDEFSENAQALLKDIKRLFGNTYFNTEKLRDKSNLPYEDFKNSLFELLESKLTMEFDENEEVIRYQLKK